MTALERFESEYQKYKGISPKRSDEQLRALQMLCESARLGEPQNCTPEHFREWLRELNERGLAPTTVKKYGMLVRPFFGWAFDVKLYSGDDLMAIKRAEFPNCPPRVPRPYSVKQIKHLWPAIAKAHPLNTDPKWLQRYLRGTSKFGRIEHHCNHLQLTAVARIAVDCGLRRQEIFDLTLEDMHYDNAYIVVREGKEKKFREVPYTKTTRAAVRDWIEMRTILAPDHDRPWLALTRIGPKGIWLREMNFRRFERYLRDAGDWHLHRLRHTCATAWLRAGMPLELVSRLLGHSNLQQTMGYAELVGEDIQRNVAKHEESFLAQVG